MKRDKNYVYYEEEDKQEVILKPGSPKNINIGTSDTKHKYVYHKSNEALFKMRDAMCFIDIESSEPTNPNKGFICEIAVTLVSGDLHDQEVIAHCVIKQDAEVKNEDVIDRFKTSGLWSDM